MDRIGQIVIQMGEKCVVIGSMLLIFLEREFDTSLNFQRLSAVKRRVSQKPRDSTGMLRRELQRMLVPLSQVIYFSLEPRKLPEILSQGIEPVTNPPTQIGCHWAPFCQRNLLTAHLPHRL